MHTANENKTAYDNISLSDAGELCAAAGGQQRKSCCFTGHRSIPFSKRKGTIEILRRTLQRLIGEGFVDFYAGGALGFDTMAALAVLELKAIYPGVRLILAFPFPSQTQRWQEKDIAVYEYIKKRCDSFIYVSEQYSSGAMFKRNRYLVDHSSVCVAYLTAASGGTAYTVQYAQTKSVPVINVAQISG